MGVVRDRRLEGCSKKAGEAGRRGYEPLHAYHGHHHRITSKAHLSGGLAHASMHPRVSLVATLGTHTLGTHTLGTQALSTQALCTTLVLCTYMVHTQAVTATWHRARK